MASPAGTTATGDQRKVPGAVIHAKAIHVLSEAECSRRFGSNKDTKVIQGTVIRAENQRTATGRSSWYVVGDFKVSQGYNKQASLHIRSVTAGPVPGATEAPAATPATDPAAAQSTTTRSTTTTQTVTQREPDALENTEETAQGPTIESTSDHVAEAHGQKWFSVNANDRNDRIGDPIPEKEWSVKTRSGEVKSPSHPGEHMTPFEVFVYLAFPLNHLVQIVAMTNERLAAAPKSYTPTTSGEILRYFGVLMLATRFEFGTRASLWSTQSSFKYEPAPCFGATGMPRDRFDTLHRFITYSFQPDERPQDMSSEEYRWMLVQGFVDAFNKQRADYFSPSEIICGDESIFRWYGMGGDWINLGLPMYVAIDRKPENGCECQDACCGRSRVMLRLKLVKTAAMQEMEDGTDESHLNHGTRVLKELVLPWCNTGTPRIVCADSYFASVQCALELKRLGMAFIGVVKTATKKYPMRYLSSLELTERGDRSGVIAKDDSGIGTLLAFVWMDRERRYFISSCSSLEEGEPYMRTRMRQVAPVESQEAPERVELTVPQPKAAETYYSACAAVDQHNRSRQDNLMLERKLGTMQWNKRVNMSILGITMVDAFNLYRGLYGWKRPEKDFYSLLAEQLIDNTYDNQVSPSLSRRRPRDDLPDVAEGQSVARPLVSGGRHAHLSPTKRKGKAVDKLSGEKVETNRALQSKCQLCQMKTKYHCSTCTKSADGKEFFLCSPETGRNCMTVHMHLVHPDEV